MIKKQAEDLVGHELEVEQTTDGKYIVLFMRFQRPPPPKSDTAEGAYQAFIDWYSAQPKESLPE